MGDDTSYATCSYCGAMLQIMHSEGATYTKVLETVRDNTAAIAADTRLIRIQGEVARLDSMWFRECDKLERELQEIKARKDMLMANRGKGLFARNAFQIMLVNKEYKEALDWLKYSRGLYEKERARLLGNG